MQTLLRHLMVKNSWPSLLESCPYTIAADAEMDGDAVISALEVGPDAFASLIPSLGKRFELFRLMNKVFISFKLTNYFVLGMVSFSCSYNNFINNYFYSRLLLHLP